ncbi:Restriction endonuclease S subunit [Blastococcus saxobsidens DD2]|uniref:Restriction endonuclease S subunit n=1 Tax=Blastococcus saxobsidens (strain DD2) TaxID=1146883 RepID=H6RV72_BLASD|nr:Restriction endonuclease S subunit [Blastococcus saxobsidens DD2]
MSMLPEGWRELSLSQIGEGGLFSDGDWVETKDQDPHGPVRLTQLADVGIARFRDKSDRWMRRDQVAAVGGTLLKPDDVLIARMPDPIGRACLFHPGWHMTLLPRLTSRSCESLVQTSIPRTSCGLSTLPAFMHAWSLNSRVRRGSGSHEKSSQR